MKCNNKRNCKTVYVPSSLSPPARRPARRLDLVRRLANRRLHEAQEDLERDPCIVPAVVICDRLVAGQDDTERAAGVFEARLALSAGEAGEESLRVEKEAGWRVGDGVGGIWRVVERRFGRRKERVPLVLVEVDVERGERLGVTAVVVEQEDDGSGELVGGE